MAINTKASKQCLLKVTEKVKMKIDKMSEVLSMPRSQCINMLVTEWLENREDRINKRGD